MYMHYTHAYVCVFTYVYISLHIDMSLTSKIQSVSVEPLPSAVEATTRPTIRPYSPSASSQGDSHAKLLLRTDTVSLFRF